MLSSFASLVRLLMATAFGAFLVTASTSGTVGAASASSFVSRCGDQLCLDGKVFRFVSFNAPELSMRENPYWDVEAPFDQEDIIRTIAEFGGRVTRTYVLSVAGAGKDPVHVEAPGQYGEEAFRSLDRVLALANQNDVKVIIPFIDTWEWWGGIPQFSKIYGVSADEFYTSDATRQGYKDLVSFVLNRRNTVTGVLYKDDPAVLAWETGNELRKAITPWTREMAAYIKSIDPNHLVLDGNDDERDAAVLDDPNIDFLTRHYYGSDFRSRFLADLAWMGSKKPMIVGEFGLAGFDELKGVVDAVVSKQTTGALIWSLRNHDSNGGWHWHCEDGGTCAYHVPGFVSGDAYDEDKVLDLLHQAAWAVRNEMPPALPVPNVPQFLPIATPLDISWRGIVGANAYDIEKSADDGMTWDKVGSDVSDSTNAHDHRILKTVVDPESGRTHEAVLTRVIFQDLTAKAGETLLYRIRAKGPGGVSAWSSPEKMAVSLVDGLMIVDPAGLRKTVVRVLAPGPIKRVELFTDADPVLTSGSCFPQVISGKDRLEVNIVDAPEVNAQGAVLVTADGAEVGSSFAIAQPCRGQVNILSLRYALGSYDLDAPRVPPRELPFPLVDDFETYAAGGLEDHWKPHPSGNKTSFVVATAADAPSPHLMVTYDLGTPNYSGVQRFMSRDNWRAYDGIKFRYRGSGGAEGFTPQFRADSGYWETNVPAPPAEWTEVKIPFTDFHIPPRAPEGATFGLTGVTELNFYVGGTSGGQYEIDDIELYKADK